MTLSEFSSAASVSKEVAEKWFSHIDAALVSSGIVNTVDIAMFIAQAGHESENFTKASESMNYTPTGLLKTFRKRITNEQAEQIGRTASHPAKQPAIANLVYGKRMGNIYPNDGWKYRGRGLLQITGRYNYKKCSEALNVDLIADPDLLCTESYAALSSCWFYVNSGCLNYPGDLRKISKIINGGEHGLGDRAFRYKIALEAMNDISNF